MTAQVVELGIPPLRALPATSTVDRRWVHRASVAEVFLTDLLATGDDTFVAYCQLPRQHVYYGDHTPGQIDPMLLLESCRQAETGGAHLRLGLPLETKFVLNRWSLECHRHEYDDRTPVTLRIDVATGIRTTGRRTDCDYAMDLSVDDLPVGRATMTVTYLDPHRYGALRTMRRRGTPPMSTDVSATPPESPAPSDVRLGRTDPRNVVLDEVVVGEGGGTARLVPPVNHASLFDHPLDHVPGVVVTEAAAQLATAVTGGRVAAFDGEFRRFVELDDVATLTAGTDADGAVTVRVEQGGDVAADVTVRCVPSGTGNDADARALEVPA